MIGLHTKRLQSAGLIPAITSNTMAMNKKPLGLWDIADMVKKIYGANAPTEGLVLWCDAVTLFQINADAVQNGLTIVPAAREINGISLSSVVRSGKNGWSGGMGNGKTYQFTLAKAVPKGGQIVWNGAWDQDPLKYDIKTYASPTSTTVIETVKPTEGTGGTELTTLNSGQRMCYGSNNYKESAVRGWLNSDKVAGSVWTPATNYDRPPSWVSNKAGFMNGMDADFLAVIGKTTKVTCRNNVTDGGGSDTTKDKFFLLSRRELFMGDEVSSVKEGEPYPYYSDYSDYTSPNTGADSNRVKYKNGSPQWQWERTPNAGSSNGVRHVSYAGHLGYNYASSSGGVAPACNVI